jgi:hypothetical protein
LYERELGLLERDGAGAYGYECEEEYDQATGLHRCELELALERKQAEAGAGGTRCVGEGDGAALPWHALSEVDKEELAHAEQQSTQAAREVFQFEPAQHTHLAASTSMPPRQQRRHRQQQQQQHAQPINHFSEQQTSLQDLIASFAAKQAAVENAEPTKC